MENNQQVSVKIDTTLVAIFRIEALQGSSNHDQQTNSTDLLDLKFNFKHSKGQNSWLQSYIRSKIVSNTHNVKHMLNHLPMLLKYYM